MPPRHRNNIAMVKPTKPRKITLRNGRIFYAKYKRVKRDALPDKVTIRHRYKRRARRE